MSKRSDFPKLIYFARRHPRLDRAAFVARWRQHARLGMSMPRWENVERYVHCDTVESQPVALPLLPCDGVAIVWYRSEERRLAHVADRTAGPALKSDELETFDRPVREVSVLTEEFCFLPPVEAARKLFLLRRRPAGVAPEDFRARCLEVEGPRLAQRLASLRAGYWQNHARPLLPDADSPLFYDLVEEIGGGDCAAVLAAVQGSGVEFEAAVLTTETLLFQR